MVETKVGIHENIIHSRVGDIDQVVAVNASITEWDSHFTKEQFANFLEGKDSLVVVGYSGDEAAGFTVGYAEGDSFYRWVSGVNPAFRGRGVFRSLHEYCENWAKERGLKRMKSDVALRRNAMVEVNRALGYRVTGFEYGEDLENSRLFFEKDLT